MDDKIADQFLKERMRNPGKLPKLPSEYSRSYTALLALANSLDGEANARDLLMLGCAVYAWMPTILQSWDFSPFDSGKISVSMLREISCPEDAATLLTNSVEGPLLNNSWVGSSKFLHFVNPNAFPIWDSRVAGRFGVKPWSINRKPIFLEYMRFCHRNVISFDSELRGISRFLDSQDGSGVTRLRMLELMLFL